MHEKTKIKQEPKFLLVSGEIFTSVWVTLRYLWVVCGSSWYFWLLNCQHFGNVCQLEGFSEIISVRPSGAGLGNMSGQECTFSYMYTCIGYKLPTFGECMLVGGFLCALWAQGWGICLVRNVHCPGGSCPGGTCPF